MNAVKRGWGILHRGLDGLLFAPRDLALCAVLRIAYASLLLINILVLVPDLELWYGEAGVLPYSASRTIIDTDTWTVFSWLPRTDATARACVAIFLVQIVLLLAGFGTRVQAVCVYLWVLSFQHRQFLIFDGEDNVFRLIGFFLIFLPSHHRFSVDAVLRARAGRPFPRQGPAWALRLIQFQMSVIYLSTLLEKLRGTQWLDGTAVYYITRLDDTGGRFPLPGFLFDSMPFLRLAGWAVLAAEAFIFWGLWVRPTRRAALVTGVVFHLTLEYTMTLFLFPWIMMVGLLAFVEADDLAWIRRRLGWPRAPQASASSF
jgi:hypothetical protein